MAQAAGKEYDPEKSDFLHGRTGPGLRFSYGRGYDASAFCHVCGKRKVWCECGAAKPSAKVTQ